MNIGAGWAQRNFSGHAAWPHAFSSRWKEHLVLDIAMLALGLIFFVVTIAYAYACDRL